MTVPQFSRRALSSAGLLLCLFVSSAVRAQSPQTITPPPPPFDPNASAQELEQKADVLRAEKRYLDSLDAYRAALAKEPSAHLWNKEGFVLLLMSRYPEAKKSFDRAIKADKKAPEAYNNRAFIEYNNKKYGRAIKDYKRALALQPNNATFHKNLAASYFDRHDFKEATAEYRTAFQLDPTIFEHTSGFGVMAQSSSPEDRARFWFMVAKLYARSGDVDHSLEYLRKAMEEGFKDYKQLYTEEEFATLRADKRFTDLMAQKPEPIQ